jgi:hypothetical protein
MCQLNGSIQDSANQQWLFVQRLRPSHARAFFVGLFTEEAAPLPAGRSKAPSTINDFSTD